MTALFARKALLPGGWTDDVRLTIDAGRIAGIQPGEKPAHDAVHNDRDRALATFAKTLDTLGSSS